jgi:glycosyltransferase 2 family protein
MGHFKKVLSLFLRVAVSCLLLVFLFKFNHISLPDVFAVIRQADKKLLFVAFLFSSVAYVLGLYRWQMLLAASQVRIPLRRVLVSFCGGQFFNLFLPSTIGGDVSRTIDLSVHTRKPKEIVATVFLDRLSGFVGLVLIALIFLAIGWNQVRQYQSVVVSVISIALVLFAVLLVVFNATLYRGINSFLQGRGAAGRIREILKNLHTEIHLFRHKKSVLVRNVLMSVLIQAVFPLTSYLICRALGVDLPVLYFFVFIPVVGAISLLPFSIGGLGIRENATVLLFANLGMPQNIALGMSLIGFFFLVIYSSIGGLVYVLGVRYRRVQSH